MYMYLVASPNDLLPITVLWAVSDDPAVNDYGLSWGCRSPVAFPCREIAIDEQTPWKLVNANNVAYPHR
jgi:hypothetical protein